MPRITSANDAYGRELWACLADGQAEEIVERDDGFVSASDWPKRYFAAFKAWPAHERQAMRFVRGVRALDVGCGAGRVSLHLQRKGLTVTAIDNSPLAIRVCRKRGVEDARVLAVEQIRQLAGATFDAVVMFGNNFGLFGGFEKARRLLRQLHGLTSPDAVILAESVNPYTTSVAAHRRYQRRNRARGRMGGQIRIRLRFRDIKGPWFDYLLVSPGEMKAILAGKAGGCERSCEAVVGRCMSPSSANRSSLLAGGDRVRDVRNGESDAQEVIGCTLQIQLEQQ